MRLPALSDIPRGEGLGAQVDVPAAHPCRISMLGSANRDIQSAGLADDRFRDRIAVKSNLREAAQQDRGRARGPTG